MNNFDLKKFLVENKLTSNSKVEEGTFDQGEIALYLGPAGLTHIFKRGSGYYGYNDEFDFEAANQEELEQELRGYELIAGSLEENRDLNDPIAMRLRAAQTKLAKTRAANAGGDGNDKYFEKSTKLHTLKKRRREILSNMEQEAEPEGGPIADRYGDMLNKIDRAIAQLQGTEKEFKLAENVTTTVWSNLSLQFLIDNKVRYVKGLGVNRQIDWHLIEKGFRGAEEKALGQLDNWKASMEHSLGIEPHEEVKIVGGVLTTDKIDQADNEAASAQASAMKKGGFSNS